MANEQEISKAIRIADLTLHAVESAIADYAARFAARHLDAPDAFHAEIGRVKDALLEAARTGDPEAIELIKAPWPKPEDYPQ